MAQNFLNKTINREKAITVIKEVKQNNPREIWSSQMRIKLNEVFKEHGEGIIAIVVIEGENVKVSVRMNSQVIFKRNEIEGVLKKPEPQKIIELRPPETETEVKEVKAAKEQAPKAIELSPSKSETAAKEVPNLIIPTKEDETPKAIELNVPRPTIETKEPSKFIIRNEEEGWRNELFEAVLGKDEEAALELGEMLCWLLDNQEEDQVIRFLKKVRNKALTGKKLWDLFLSQKLPKGRYGYRSFMYRFLIYS